jgi:hypothetical protein
MSNTNTLLSCHCGGFFKDSLALMQHTRDSALHLQQPVVHPPASLVVPVVLPVRNPQRGPPLLTANIPAGVRCPCGKVVKDDDGLMQHTRDSPRHLQQLVLHPPANLVVPVVPPVQDPQPDSPLPTANIPAGVKCPCGKLVKDDDGLKRHLRFSSRHRKLEVACIADVENKASHRPPDEGVVGLTSLLCTCARKV